MTRSGRLSMLERWRLRRLMRQTDSAIDKLRHELAVIDTTAERSMITYWLDELRSLKRVLNDLRWRNGR